MRVLQIIPNLTNGGAERLTIDICNALQNKGCEVKLISFGNHNGYGELIKDIDWIILNEKSNLRFLRGYYPFAQKLQKIIDNFQPNIIHTHLFEAEIISRSCFYHKAKWFSHLHDNMPQLRNLSLQTLLNKKQLINFYEKQWLLQKYKNNGGNSFIAISRDTLKYGEKVLTPICEINYLKNAINYDNFYCKRNFLEETKLKLINIGSFQPKKNQQFLVDIAKVLKDKEIDFELRFLGDGELKSNIQEKVQKLRLQNQVFFEGNVSNVSEYLNKSNLYVHSAYYEPFGLVLLEAMAAGLPVVSLDGKGNRDIMVDGENGYMLQEQDAILFANKIIELWKDRILMNQISVKANEFAKNYDITQYCTKLLTLYQEAIDSK
ncbi:MAG: glycosyltransferase [Chitinophagales bacterium]|nr:glycosyltransferase [Bacteroidota bacterium]